MLLWHLLVGRTGEIGGEFTNNKPGDIMEPLQVTFTIPGDLVGRDLAVIQAILNLFDSQELEKEEIEGVILYLLNKFMPSVNVLV